jgi:protease I
LEEAGAEVRIVSPQKQKVKAWDKDHWSIELPVDDILDNVAAENYDALVLPGGVMNPDQVRMNKKAVEFAKQFLESGKPVVDLENAGVWWVDEEVMTDNGLVTSRTPKDLDAFNRKTIQEIGEGRHTPASYTPGPRH